MSPTQGERVTALEVEMKHMALANAEMAQALQELRKELHEMRAEQAAIYNQITGGKKTLAGLLLLSSGVGGTVMWFLKEFLPFLSRGP